VTAISEAPSGCKEMAFLRSRTFAAQQDRIGRKERWNTVQAERLVQEGERRGAAEAKSC